MLTNEQLLAYKFYNEFFSLIAVKKKPLKFDSVLNVSTLNWNTPQLNSKRIFDFVFNLEKSILYNKVGRSLEVLIANTEAIRILYRDTIYFKGKVKSLEKTPDCFKRFQDGIIGTYGVLTPVVYNELFDRGTMEFFGRNGVVLGLSKVLATKDGSLQDTCLVKSNVRDCTVLGLLKNE